MKINKDLVEAAMMLGAISLVLIGTSDFDDATAKNGVMIAVGILTIIMGVLRFIPSKHSEESEVTE